MIAIIKFVLNYNNNINNNNNNNNNNDNNFFNDDNKLYLFEVVGFLVPSHFLPDGPKSKQGPSGFLGELGAGLVCGSLELGIHFHQQRT